MPQPNVDTASDAFTEELANCDFNDPSSVSDLITGRHTPQVYRNQLIREEFKHPGSVCNFFSDYFGFEDFDWGKCSLKRETYHAPMLESAFNAWVKKDFQCSTDPTDPTECAPCFEELPTGGYSTDDVEFFSAYLKTKPYCIANLKCHRDYFRYQDMIIKDQLKMSEQRMQDFFTMAAVRTAGHKILLETGHPLGNTSPYPILDEFPNNYRENYFNEPTDPDNIVAFDLGMAQQLTFDMIDTGMTGAAAMVDGRHVFDIWTGSDWHTINVLQDADFADKIKFTAPNQLFKGFTFMDGNRTVHGNVAHRTVPCLPRFADETGGTNNEIVQVQAFNRIAVEIGDKFVANKDHKLAPYELILLPSPNQASILRPQTITSSQGIPITPLYDSAGWKARNPYDKECNPQENMPWWEWQAHMGLAPNLRDEGVVLLARRQVYRTAPRNTCNLMPRRSVNAETFDCPDTPRVQASITEAGDGCDQVSCEQVVCGDASQSYLKLDFKSQREAFSVDCACGTEAIVNLDDGSTNVVQIIDDARMNPDSLLLVQRLDAAGGNPTDFDAARDVVSICCQAPAAASASVVSCVGSDDDGVVSVVLDAILECEVGDAVTAQYRGPGADNDQAATITSVDYATLTYVLAITDTDYDCDDSAGANTGNSLTGVVCV